MASSKIPLAVPGLVAGALLGARERVWGTIWTVVSEPRPRSSAELEATISRLRSELEHALVRVETADGSLAELSRSQELSRRLIEAMPGGVVRVDADGAIRTANAEALRVLGYSYDALTSRYVRDFEAETLFEDGSECPQSEYPVTKALRTGKAQPPTTIGVRRPDGGISWAIFTAVPLADERGATIGAVATFMDITRRKRLERDLRVAQKLETVVRFARGIAHGFDDLFTGIVRSARSLQASLRLDESQLAETGRILSAAERAGHLTRQLSVFARRTDGEPKSVALDTLVTGIADTIRRTLGASITLVLEAASEPWPVRMDRGQFEHLLLNLVTNARDAMPTGGTLTIHVENGDADDVRLSVIDTGRGITASDLEHLFDPFFTTKAPGDGAGLGLAMCHGIVQQAGGTISVQSEVGRGTTFQIRLPRVPRSGRSASPIPGSDAVPVPATVFLVEREPLLRRAIERSLERRGYAVISASTDVGALSALADHPGHVDLFLADIPAPHVSARELAQRVRAERPGIRIVFMSHFADDLEGDYGLSETDPPLLRKPFYPADLLGRVRAALASGASS